MTETTPAVNRSEAEPKTPRDRSYLERIEANLAIAEQTMNVAHEMDRAPATEPGMRTKLAVSVVIPVYNERDTVVEIVRRVQAVGIHREIILVDDFSMDGTRQILTELAREDDVRILFHGYNKGKGAALRTGFQQANGDVVLVHEGDNEVRNGGVYAFRLDNDLFIKRLQRQPGGRIIARSDNAKLYDPFELGPDDDVSIIGRAVWSGGKL